jgi:hypothetical protein
VSDRHDEVTDYVDKRVPDCNDWAIVHKPGSKFHGHPCHMKNLIDSESRRANVYVYFDGEYHLHLNAYVKYKQCRLMAEEEIELLRSNLGTVLHPLIGSLYISKYRPVDVRRQGFPIIVA